MSGAPVSSGRGRAALFIALLAGVVVLVACGDSPAPSKMPATQSPVPSSTAPPTTQPPAGASSAPPGDTPPPLNRLEVKVIDALARLEITGQRAELPFNNAAIWADFGAGSQLFVNAAPTGTTRGQFTVIDERQLEGTRVQRVQYSGFSSPRYRFECSADTYEVDGATPPGFADMDAFVSRFIRALGCGA
jgi:hypothetical protein